MKSLVVMIYDSRRDSDHGTSGNSVATETKHSIATIPLQRDAARKFALSHDCTIGAELIIEYGNEFDLGKVTSNVVSNLDSNSDIEDVLVTNLDLFNSSGLASKLIPLIGANKLLPI